MIEVRMPMRNSIIVNHDWDHCPYGKVLHCIVKA